MGIPVVAKNYFPSNIQGLPTWYEVRVSENGYLAPSGEVDIMVAMNAQTYEKDIAEIVPGGYLIYDSTWSRKELTIRKDVTVLGVPLAQMCNENFDTARARTLMKNTAYVGVLAALLEVEMKVVEQLLLDSFGSKVELIDANNTKIRFMDSIFDVVVAWHVLYYNNSTGFLATMQEITRVLKKKGIFIGALKAPGDHFQTTGKLIGPNLYKLCVPGQKGATVLIPEEKDLYSLFDYENVQVGYYDYVIEGRVDKNWIVIFEND